MTKAVFRRLCEKMLAKFTPKPTQANADVINGVNTYDDFVEIGFVPKYLEISETRAGTLYLWVGDESDVPPIEIPPMINRLQDMGGNVHIEELDVGRFHLSWPYVGTAVDIHWKAFA